MDHAGGYIPNEGGQQKGPSGGGGDPQKSKKVTVVFLKQVREQTNSEGITILHRQQFQHLVVIGKVTSSNETVSKCTYTIQDTTGRAMEIQHWRYGAADTDPLPGIQVGDYVRVYGHGRLVPGDNKPGGPEVFISAFRVTKLSDANSLTLHLLESVVSGLCLAKKKRNRLANLPSMSGFPNGMTAFNANQSVSAGPATYQNTGMKSGGSGMTPAQSAVLAALTACQTSEGLNVDALSVSIRNVPPAEIKKALDFLSNEGHIYTTIDDNHYKSTDG